jgi:small subunit ribosomal protein S16
MAVSIRLARQGSKKRPFYRIVAADKRSPRDGRFIEQIGSYDPRVRGFHLDMARYEHWLGNGAQASETVASLVRRNAREAR